MPNLILDETDKKILSILHEEGRISYTDLGKRVGLSRVAVQTRINNLIEEGIIEKFTASSISQSWNSCIGVFQC
jgi:DNA-binding Lrp family transcriptional regulator